jgi:glyoxylase-like metal-dependent hydrolase (beta-lactamase superfamily II)
MTDFTRFADKSLIPALTVFLASFALFAMMAAPAWSQRTYDRVPIVKEGTTVKISPHVYVIPDENTRGVPNVGIVVGSRATVVIDPSTKIIRAVAQQQDVEEMGLKVVAEFSARSPELADLLKDIKSFRAPAETFERDKTLDLGGVRVKLMRLGPAHTRGDTAIFVEGDGVLFSGDLAMKQAFPAFATPQSRADSWITSLDALSALRPSQVVGAHYGMGDASIISAYRGYFTALHERVTEMKKQGKSSDETATTLRNEFRAKYPDWDQPLRVHSAATAIYAELP